jgi:pimeloyl-ACP methyl ester carboxylesterase
VLLGRPWGFELRDISTPVNLWQGESDVLVPPAMARHMCAQLPDCRACYFPGEGHLLVIDHMAEIIEAFEKG